MTVRDWHVQRALESYRQLVSIIDELTEEEVLACLDLEVGTRRRATLVERLIQQAADLHRQNYVKSLKEKYHGSRQIRRTQPR
jgi:hypothetical protein